MKLFYKIFYVFILIIFPLEIRPQNSTVIDINRGLTTNNVTDLTFDEKGNLWLGSYNGLMKHEGGRITKITSVGRDENSLSSIEMHSIIEDKCGQIWVATSAGVDIIDPVTLKIRHVYPKSPVDGSSFVGYIYWIHQDNEEFVWISTDVGMYIIDNNTLSCEKIKETKDYSGLPSQIILYNGGVNTENGMWIHTRLGLAFRETATRHFFHKFNNPRKLKIFNSNLIRKGLESDLVLDKSGKLWFYQNVSCLTSYDIVNDQIDTFHVPFPKGTWSCCKSLAIDHEENVWIGSRHGGFIIFDTRTQKFKNYKFTGSNSLIPSNYIHAISRGADGNMYLTTNRGLVIVNFYDKVLLKRYLSDEPDFINIKYEAGDINYDPFRKSIFFPFYNLGFVEYNIDKDSFLFEGTTKNISTSLLLPLNKNQSYMAINGGFSLYNHSSGKIDKSTFPVPGLDSIKGNVVWYQKTKTGFIAKKTRGKLLHFVNGKMNVHNSYGFKTMAAYNESTNEIWNLNWDLHLQKIDVLTGKSSIKNIHPTLSKSNFFLNITRKLLYDNGDVWITSNNGVLRYSASMDTIFTYTMREGLSNSFVFNVVMDSFNNIWVSSLGGIDVFNRNTNRFINVVAENNTSYMDAFGHALCAGDGKLFFHLGNKLFIIDSKEYIKRKPIKKELILSSIMINEKYTNIENQELLKLNASQNNIKIAYAIRDFINPELANYFYKINDNDWINNGNHTEINFSQLSSGEYNIFIKAVDNFGMESANLLNLRFTISPVLYKRWWFVFLGLFMIVFGIVYYYRNRIKKIQQQKHLSIQMAELRATALKAQMNPHFLFNSLNAIQETIILNDTEKAYDYLSSFSKFLRKVLNYSEVQFITIAEEIELMKLYVDIESQRFVQKINLIINVDEEIENELIPTMITQSFIENSVWHGLRTKVKDKTIWLTFTLNGDFIKVEIKDNGIGFINSKKNLEFRKKTKEYQSKGLDITSQRIKNLFSNNAFDSNIIISEAFMDKEYPGTYIYFMYPIVSLNKR